MDFYIVPEIEAEVKKMIRVKKEIVYPTRKLSVVIKPRLIKYRTLDMTLCKDCICFKQEAPYVTPASNETKSKIFDKDPTFGMYLDLYIVKLRQCLRTPPTLYELAAAVVDALPLPRAFSWSVQDVANWMSDVVGLPQYRECITKNNIDGLRLVMLEDPSRMPDMNVHYFSHIKMITAEVRKLYGLDYIRFARSIGLPPRRPLVHSTIFKSRTRPSDSERIKWTTSDLLRWMKILRPKPEELNHWDRVRYMKPDFPKTLFGRIPLPKTREHVPVYRKPVETPCREYQTPRKFILCPEYSDQMIWMEEKKLEKPVADVKTKKVRLPKKNRFDRKKIDLSKLRGEKYILAKRLVPSIKFFPKIYN